MVDFESIKIPSKIKSYEIITKKKMESKDSEKALLDEIAELKEENVRLRGLGTVAIPEGAVLEGRRYKVEKSSASADAYYIQIFDIVDAGQRRPYEIFISSKSPEHFQWITALTRVITSIFKRERNLEFLAKDLKEIFSLTGGYHRRGGVYFHSIVAEIGAKLEEHLRSIKEYNDILNEDPLSSDHEVRDKMAALSTPPPTPENTDNKYKDATFCPICKEKKYINTGGCTQCLGCGYSTCG